MIKAMSPSCTALSLSAPAPQSSRATIRCLGRDDMIKAVSSMHCLVFVGASSTEQSVETTSHGGHDLPWTSRRLTDVTTSHGRQLLTEVTTSHRSHDVSRTSRRFTEVATSHGRHDVSWASRRLMEITTSQGGHDVSRRSPRLTDVTMSRRSPVSHGGHDVSRRSRRLTRGHDLFRRPRRFMEVTTPHGRYDVPWTSRHLTEVTTSHGG